MRLPIIHHPGYSIDLPEGHPFPMGKFQALRRQLHWLDGSGLAEWIEPEPVAEVDLLRIHTADYVQAFLTGSLDAAAQRRSGFKWSEALVSRVRLETGGTLRTVEAALATGLALNTAGGTHHAHADAASGYCLINDIAVAAAHALAMGWIGRVLIIDLDVHQGDGTAGLFAHTREIFTFSVHAQSNFPARKLTSDLDVALPRGVGDAEYLDALAQRLPDILASFRPELVIYDAGVDVHARDRLGHLDLSDAGIRERDSYVIRTCREANVPVAAVIGGGYDRDIEALAARHAILHEAAAAYWKESR